MRNHSNTTAPTSIRRPLRKWTISGQSSVIISWMITRRRGTPRRMTSSAGPLPLKALYLIFELQLQTSRPSNSCNLLLHLYLYVRAPTLWRVMRSTSSLPDLGWYTERSLNSHCWARTCICEGKSQSPAYWYLRVIISPCFRFGPKNRWKMIIFCSACQLSTDSVWEPHDVNGSG